MNSDEETVPCETCGTPTDYLGTKRCNNCYEVENRLAKYLADGGEHARAFVVTALNSLFVEDDPPRMGRRIRKTVAIDFDGVIHKHVSKWTTASEIHDGPVDGALEFLEELLVRGEFNVAIFSARAADLSAVPAMRLWLAEHWTKSGRNPKWLRGIPISSKKPHAFIYIDDRGWCFEGRFPTVDELRNFESWTKKTADSLLGTHTGK